MAETARPAPSHLGGFMRTITKMVRFRRNSTAGGKPTIGISPEDDNSSILKFKFPDYFDNTSILSRGEEEEEENEKKNHQQLQNRAAVESFLAGLFASISAIKASYAQLQIAESPYDPETIQKADMTVVSELKHLSQLKHSYMKKNQQKQLDNLHHHHNHNSQLLAELEEQRNLLKTFQITAKKLEADLHHKDLEIHLLKEHLSESEKQNKALESKLHPNTLDEDIHLSGPNPALFLPVLRRAVKSVRSFVRTMTRKMERCRWDLDAAAGSIQPDVLCGEAEHRVFAFESFVFRVMLSDFHRPEFGLGGNVSGRLLFDRRRRFLDEFLELKSATARQILLEEKGDFRRFCTAKYLALVHPKMEASFFGSLEQRKLVSSGEGFPFPETEFFASFAEMARRVWLLHCLFFSFEPEAAAEVYEVRRGCRFSEVYMESVVEEAEHGGAAVGFTVVPGFRVGKTVVQCKVYLVRNGRL